MSISRHLFVRLVDTSSACPLRSTPVLVCEPNIFCSTASRKVVGMNLLRSSSISRAFRATASSQLSKQADHKKSSPTSSSAMTIALISYGRMFTESSSSSRCQSCRSVQSCVSSLPVSSHLTVCFCVRGEPLVGGVYVHIVPLCIFSSFHSTRTRLPTKAAPLILQPLFCPSLPATCSEPVELFTSPKKAW